MDVSVRLTDLAVMHPRLLWGDIILAAMAVLRPHSPRGLLSFAFTMQDIPGFAQTSLTMAIEPAEASPALLDRVRRTYEPPRLVELAAIAVTGLAIHLAGGHEIRDVSLRGSAADYLVDEANNLLEIAGRSRRSDLESAWDQRWQRLGERLRHGFYVCVVEFETQTGRLGYQP